MSATSTDLFGFV